MREILFRGKRKDNGEWVYGSLVKDGKPDMREFYIMTIPTFDEKFCVQHEVDPETVGQFTGLTDKNGKKIFEGDIVKTDSEDACLSRGIPHLVAFDDKYSCGFVLKWKSVTQLFESVWKKSEVLEVIGNIHDNPELLEVAK